MYSRSWRVRSWMLPTKSSRRCATNRPRQVETCSCPRRRRQVRSLVQLGLFTFFVYNSLYWLQERGGNGRPAQNRERARKIKMAARARIFRVWQPLRIPMLHQDRSAKNTQLEISLATVMISYFLLYIVQFHKFFRVVLAYILAVEWRAGV